MQPQVRHRRASLTIIKAQDTWWIIGLLLKIRENFVSGLDNIICRHVFLHDVVRKGIRREGNKVTGRDERHKLVSRSHDIGVRGSEREGVGVGVTERFGDLQG